MSFAPSIEFGVSVGLRKKESAHLFKPKFHTYKLPLTVPLSPFSLVNTARLEQNTWVALLKASNMAAAKIIGAITASFAVAYGCDYMISDGKIFGGTTPHTLSNKGWWEETDRKFQAWPRTAGPPVVMNPISRQNFIIKSSDS